MTISQFISEMVSLILQKQWIISIYSSMTSNINENKQNICFTVIEFWTIRSHAISMTNMSMMPVILLIISYIIAAGNEHLMFVCSRTQLYINLWWVRLMLVTRSKIPRKLKIRKQYFELETSPEKVNRTIQLIRSIGRAMSVEPLLSLRQWCRYRHHCRRRPPFGFLVLLSRVHVLCLNSFDVMLQQPRLPSFIIIL